MAAIQTQPAGRSKTKLHSVKIDMTPMVDLGFLLITFFIFTTSMAEPKITRLIMPKDGSDGPDVPESKALTALLDKDKIFVYSGRWEDAKRSNHIVETNYDVRSGLGNLIREKQNQLNIKGQGKELVFIVKPMATSSYQNLISALDEVLINDLNYYAVTGISKEEAAFGKTKQ